MSCPTWVLVRLENALCTHTIAYTRRWNNLNFPIQLLLVASQQMRVDNIQLLHPTKIKKMIRLMKRQNCRTEGDTGTTNHTNILLLELVRRLVNF